MQREVWNIGWDRRCYRESAEDSRMVLPSNTPIANASSLASFYLPHHHVRYFVPIVGVRRQSRHHCVGYFIPIVGAPAIEGASLRNHRPQRSCTERWRIMFLESAIRDCAISFSTSVRLFSCCVGVSYPCQRWDNVERGRQHE